jgi:hypothetical protein
MAVMKSDRIPLISDGKKLDSYWFNFVTY